MGSCAQINSNGKGHVGTLTGFTYHGRHKGLTMAKKKKVLLLLVEVGHDLKMGSSFRD
jgi:hypothetical protein